jgi:ATP-dependent Clp protease ATP-binding subunit ClpC
VKKVLALAAKEAKALNHTYVGTEHILLGLLREGDGVAARVLKNLDVDIEQTRQEILKELDPNFNQGEEQAVPETPEKVPEKKGEVKTPALKAFGRDLTDLARKGEMDPVIGRRNEIERVIQILCRRTKTIPFCWAKPAWARQPSSRVWPRRLPRATFPRFCVRNA